MYITIFHRDAFIFYLQNIVALFVVCIIMFTAGSIRVFDYISYNI